MSLVEVKNLKKVYTSKLGTNGVVALRDVNFNVERGEYVAVMGESGSGKTTLLNILAALDRASSGEVILDGMNLSAIRDGEISAFRRDNLGFVFQDFNLLDTFTLRDNIYLPRVLAGAKPSQMEAELKLIAEYLGITHILDKFPYEV
ncbi:MAG: ATP-binding cassette domain-containing protein, partial [[Eubacterium] sulci]|nr:ATP-binding cassette domain-containing protein [[Eubacterium] sulci]